jgi:hypothetical protein
MRTKGSVSSIEVQLETLNRILKPNAKIMVSKRFYDAISLLISENNAVQAVEAQAASEAQVVETPIHVETL